ACSSHIRPPTAGRCTTTVRVDVCRSPCWVPTPTAHAVADSPPPPPSSEFIGSESSCDRWNFGGLDQVTFGVGVLDVPSELKCGLCNIKRVKPASLGFYFRFHYASL
ncbi:unnamed protein product, partial [Citrullus colocynthis]